MLWEYLEESGEKGVSQHLSLLMIEARDSNPKSILLKNCYWIQQIDQLTICEALPFKIA